MPELIKERVEACFKTAENHFNCSLQRPEISFKLRGQKAGVAHICDNRLRFNPVLYQENPEHFLLHTVAHEVAHLVAYRLYGKNIRAHGREWQAVMEEVYGLPANRCHSYAVKRKPSTHYLYSCQCSTREPFALSAQRHARSKKGTRYICKECRTTLLYTSKTVQR
ncbi:SprT family zinc-dependent metalloprotease [Pseudomonas sp. C27(2019)]|uniref:SprT family zinc-dependent metalloprotease n=1 Tax=Pseudomonas sp. C27(2019) TaxID=2604941 RepID=UPI001248650F|nr:SprT family zinc-dependent metalloprotease [Pseudomonas sp. C27(2019)]QEY59036.1 SprT family zinc-dependent metalloprotease [Pseudomonas sp. C27(2019)]